MKIRIFVGFVLGVAMTAAAFFAANVWAIVQDPGPILTSIAPNHGYTTGGEEITITGRYLDEVTEVLFDNSPAAIQTTSTNAMVVIAPPHTAGFVSIAVTNPVTSVSVPNAYEFITPPPPSVISLLPDSGPMEGGTNVIVAGSFLAELESATFDGLPATIISTNNSQAAVSTPPHEAGFVEVMITTPYGSASVVDGFEYIDTTPPPVPMPPTISSLDPAQGSIEGGTNVTIHGLNLATVETVTFDDLEALIVDVTDTELTVSTPAHPAATVNVAVTNPDGTTTSENGFTFVADEEPAYVYCNGNGNGNSKKDKALVCHEQSRPRNTFKTLCLPLEAIPAHLAQGDKAGACPGD